MPSEWLPSLWGGEEPAFNDAEQARIVTGAIMGRYDESSSPHFITYLMTIHSLSIGVITSSIFISQVSIGTSSSLTANDESKVNSSAPRLNVIFLPERAAGTNR